MIQKTGSFRQAACFYRKISAGQRVGMKGVVIRMNIWSHMEGYDRELDENEFDQKLWDAIREEEFEFDEQFEDYLHAYGFDNVHSFLKVVRRKKTMGILHDWFVVGLSKVHKKSVSWNGTL